LKMICNFSLPKMDSFSSPIPGGAPGAVTPTPSGSNKSSKAATLSTSRAAKIPRPANSFLIYRKEHAVKFAGLVATALSAKLAISWRNESPERLKHYADLAAKAKEEHKRMYPNYKFSPAKRGTGKRARALQAAAAQAAKEAAMSLPVQAPILNTSQSQHMSIAPRKKSSNASRSIDMSALITPSPSPSASCSPSPPPETERTTLANRPKRVIQRPERFSPCGYRERPSLSVRIKSSGSPDPEPCSTSTGAHSSPLFYSSNSDRAPRKRPASSRPSRVTKSYTSSRSRKSTAPNRSCKLASSSSNSRDASSDTCVESEGIGFSDTSLSSGLEDNGSGDKDYEDKTMATTRSAGGKKVPQSFIMTPTPARTRSPSFQSDEPLFYNTTFTSPYIMENFEPECLPREDCQWPAAALVGSFAVLGTPPQIDISPILFSEYMYPTPAFEEPMIDFAEYANFDQDVCNDANSAAVKVEDKDDAKTVVDGGSNNAESDNREFAFPLAVDTIAAGLPTFPTESMIPLSLLSPTSATARAMESMSL
ncbi:Casanova, partial [Mortierella sp. 14UC]